MREGKGRGGLRSGVRVWGILRVLRWRWVGCGRSLGADRFWGVINSIYCMVLWGRSLRDLLGGE